MSLADIDAFLAGLVASQVFIHGVRSEKASLFYDDYDISDAKVETVTGVLLFYIFGILGCACYRTVPSWVVNILMWAQLVVWLVATAGVGYSFSPIDVHEHIIDMPSSIADRTTVLACKHTAAGFFFFVTLVDALTSESFSRVALVSIQWPLQAVFWASAMSYGEGSHIYVDRMAFVCVVMAVIIRILLAQSQFEKLYVHPSYSRSSASPASAVIMTHTVSAAIFASYAFIPFQPMSGTDVVSVLWGVSVGAAAVLLTPRPSGHDIVVMIAAIVMVGLCAAGYTGFFWGPPVGAIWTWLSIQPGRHPADTSPGIWMMFFCLASTVGTILQFGIVTSGTIVGSTVVTLLSIVALVCISFSVFLLALAGWNGFSVRF